jgi:hypothetical protein
MDKNTNNRQMSFKTHELSPEIYENFDYNSTYMQKFYEELKEAKAQGYRPLKHFYTDKTRNDPRVKYEHMLKDRRYLAEWKLRHRRHLEEVEKRRRKDEDRRMLQMLEEEIDKEDEELYIKFKSEMPKDIPRSQIKYYLKNWDFYYRTHSKLIHDPNYLRVKNQYKYTWV